MKAHTVMVHDDDLRKWLSSELRGWGIEPVRVVQSLEPKSVDDLSRVAAIVIQRAATGEGSKLHSLVPDLRRHDEYAPKWIPKFYLSECSASARAGAQKRFATSRAELLTLLRSWMAANPRSNEETILRRRDLETMHRGSIVSLRVPDELPQFDGGDLAYIPTGTRYWDSKLQEARYAAESREPVLLQGATGCGKEIFARLIASLYCEAHNNKDGKFIAVNASILSAELRDICGVGDKMATGVIKRTGIIENSRRGILFLDEVATLQPELQPQLLRVLSSRDFTDANGRMFVWDGKLISATNERIDQEKFKFRPDLFQRLRAHHIFLKGHADLDAPDKDVLTHGVLLCTLIQIEREWEIPEDKHLFDITEAGLTKLLSYNFNGNIRELRHVIQRAAHFSIDKYFVIDMECLPTTAGDSAFNVAELRPFTDVSVLLDRILNVSEHHGLEFTDVILRLTIDHLENKNHPSVRSMDKLKDKLGVGKDTVRRIKRDEALKSAVAPLLELSSTQPVVRESRQKNSSRPMQDGFAHELRETEPVLPDDMRP